MIQKQYKKISFAGNLNRAEGGTMFFIIEETKGTVLDFSKVTVEYDFISIDYIFNIKWLNITLQV